jgi:hypothetical protein
MEISIDTQSVLKLILFFVMKNKHPVTLEKLRYRVHPLTPQAKIFFCGRGEAH